MSLSGLSGLSGLFGAVFNPASLNNLQLWLDASDLATLWQDTGATTPAAASTDPIKRLNDKSGNSRNATNGNAGLFPLLNIHSDGKNEILFDGVNDYLLTTSFVVSQPFTIYIAYRSVVWINGGRLIDGGTANRAVINNYPSAPSISMYAGSAFVDTAFGPDNGLVAELAAVYNGASSALYVNQVTGTGNPGANSISDGLTIGAAGTKALNANIALREILIYSGAHSSTDRATVKAYLKSKWNVAYQSILLIADGDSIMLGYSLPTASSMPSQLVALVTGGIGRVRMSNFAVTGQTVADMNTDAATQVDGVYSSAYDKRICLVWGGTNDLYFGASAATAYSRLTTYWAARRAAGWTVVAFTITPRSAGSPPADFETQRANLNSSIRSGSANYDVLVDVAADSRLGDAGDETNTTYYLDLVHMTQAGYAIVAGLTYTALQNAGYV